MNVFAAMGLLGFAILFEFIGSAFLPLLGTAGVVLLSVSLGYLGVRLLKMPEEEWITRVRMDA